MHVLVKQSETSFVIYNLIKSSYTNTKYFRQIFLCIREAVQMTKKLEKKKKESAQQTFLAGEIRRIRVGIESQPVMLGTLQRLTRDRLINKTKQNQTKSNESWIQSKSFKWKC